MVGTRPCGVDCWDERSLTAWSGSSKASERVCQETLTTLTSMTTVHYPPETHLGPPSRFANGLSKAVPLAVETHDTGCRLPATVTTVTSAARPARRHDTAWAPTWAPPDFGFDSCCKKQSQANVAQMLARFFGCSLFGQPGRGYARRLGCSSPAFKVDSIQAVLAGSLVGWCHVNSSIWHLGAPGVLAPHPRSELATRNSRSQDVPGVRGG